MTPLVPSDLYRLALPSDPRIAPDGGVFYVLATQDEPANETRTSIWRAGPEGAPVPFTAGVHDRLPRVSPDGAWLAFVGERDDAKRIFVMPTSGGEARALGPAFDAIVALAWSPDSTRLAFSAKAPADAATDAIALDERTGARHIRALPFKSDDDGLLDGRRRHLFVLSLADAAPVEPRRLTFGDFDANAPAWSPDGSRIAFTARIGRPEASFSEDLYTIASDGGDVVKLTASLGPAFAPAYSHDGSQIAFLGHEHGDDLGGFHAAELFTVPATGGTPRSLSASLDRPTIDYVNGDTRGTGGQQPPAWGADDREIFVQLASEGACGVVAIASDGSSVRHVLGGERDVFAFTRADDGTLAFAFTTPTVPSEIAILDRGGVERTLTACNPWLADRAVRAPRRLRPRAADGTVLDLWLLDPDAGRRRRWRSRFGRRCRARSVCAASARWAAHGVRLVLYVRVSDAREPRYRRRLRQPARQSNVRTRLRAGDPRRLGRRRCIDVLALLDATLANAPADPARVGLAGGSYGGFMTTWLLGHSDRFAAGVSMRAVNDFVSEVGATDAGWFLENELAAPWTDGGRKLFERSPMRTAHAIAVPLLIEHSERDYRCAIDQGEQLFTLLRRLGRTDVEFVRFTGDGHGLSRTGKPRNRLLRLRAIAQWLIRHLRPAGLTPVVDYAGALFAPLPTE
jgi:dipeptidyl aminopeptidase/acylaminoacyl peptidase